jgi:hypothetical protein
MQQYFEFEQLSCRLGGWVSKSVAAIININNISEIDAIPIPVPTPGGLAWLGLAPVGRQ